MATTATGLTPAQNMAALAYDAGFRHPNITVATAIGLASQAQSGTAWKLPDMQSLYSRFHATGNAGDWSAIPAYASGVYKPYMTQAQRAYVTSGASGATGDVSAPATSASFLGINTPNWLGGFGGTSVLGSIADVIGSSLDFLKLIAWLFHPRNILRAVEFLVGMVLMIFGIWAAMQGRLPSAPKLVKSESRYNRNKRKLAEAGLPEETDS